MLWVALLLIVLTWSAAIIWGAWRARWIVAATVGLGGVLAIIGVAQRLGGPEPVGYGVALGISIFLAAAMMMLGAIATVVLALARRDRE